MKIKSKRNVICDKKSYTLIHIDSKENLIEGSYIDIINDEKTIYKGINIIDIVDNKGHFTITIPERIRFKNNGNCFIKLIDNKLIEKCKKKGYCEYFNEDNYNIEEIKYIEILCDKFNIDIKKIRVHYLNKYDIKTGYPDGTIDNLKNGICDKAFKFKITQGMGGGGRGSNGFVVEDDVNDEINKKSELRNIILNNIPTYKKNRVIWFSKNNIENTRRKINIYNNTINFNNNTVRNISDMKIHFHDMHHSISGILFISDEYISQKSSGLVTFINSGVQKECFNKEEMKQCDITEKGKTLLGILGLEVVPFCRIFNNYDTGNKLFNKDIAILYNREFKFDLVDNIFLKKNLEDLIKKSMGEGTIIISHRLGDKDIVYKNKEKKINILKYNSYYGGKSKTAKRIDVYIETEEMMFQFNIRNKQGGIYPSHLMCDFRYL